MFNLSKIFSRYRKRAEKRDLVISVIEGLRISEDQKTMYRDSLAILDEAAMDAFYEQLMGIFDIMDERDSIESQKRSHDTVIALRRREESDRSDDNAEFLLNTL